LPQRGCEPAAGRRQRPLRQQQREPGHLAGPGDPRGRRPGGRFLTPPSGRRAGEGVPSFCPPPSRRQLHMETSLRRRPGWLKYALLAILAAAGLTVGLYLSWSTESPAGPPPSLTAYPLARFPVSALDATNNMEGPQLAVRPDGGVFLCWSSQTAE